MELDVHLAREGDEPWGFEFIGGADSHQPLTIHQVLPSSPAQAAGLQPGDLVARLGDTLTDKLTQDQADAIVAESVATISFGICRGLYDPVLDDFEPIYEPTDRADSDLRSEPTEEYIREIERKSSLLASAIDETIKSIEEYKEEVGIDNEVTFKLPLRGKITNGLANGHENSLCSENGKEISQDLPKDQCQIGVSEIEGVKESELPGFKPVVFNPEAYQAKLFEEVVKGSEPAPVQVKRYVDESGEPLGTVQGIVDGLEDATVDEEVAKELGKPGMTEDKIAELISGESEMLREAHVMGLTRVLTSHMTRPDDSSVDFQKIKPLYESLKDSEVLKALNEEIKRECELKKKKDEKKWTTFLQKPKRPVPRAKFGYIGNVETEEVDDEEPYKVKIVKQPKPKVAPDYKPEDFDTGPLPWEQRALAEPVPSPVPPEEPILVPEEAEFFEAVDPLPESEVPDLEDTGIPLPPTPPPAIPTDVTETETQVELEVTVKPEDQVASEAAVEPEVQIEPEAPNASSDMDQNAMAQQLVNSVKSMVDPSASLEQQLCQMRAQLSALAQLPCVIQQSLELLTRQLAAMGRQERHQVIYQEQTTMQSHQEISENSMATIQEHQESSQNGHDETVMEAQNTVTIEEVQEDSQTVTAEENAALKREQDAAIEEQRRSEKEKKIEKWNKIWPWGDTKAYCRQYRINFMKYEKPPVNLDHLQNSATYRLVHNLEDAPLKRTDLLTPVVAEADYRERCRSATPAMQVNGRA